VNTIRGAALEKDVYFTPGKAGRFELRVKGSRFIGHAAFAASRELAEQLVDSICRQYADATHCCYAYRIGTGDAAVFRTHDAEEPSGTAGRPILEAIDRRHLTNAVCVVARYFGGVKLGTGGLARAYGECAGKAIDAGGIEERYLTETLRIRFGYEATGRVMGTIRKHRVKVEKGDFKSASEIRVLVRKSHAQAFCRDLRDATSGKVDVSNDPE